MSKQSWIALFRAPMRTVVPLRVPLVVAAAVICAAGRTGVKALLSPGVGDSRPGTMDVVYAAPGDVWYTYGPSLRQRALMADGNVATSTIVVTYDAGFNANPAAKAAFQAAVNIWQSAISTPIPIRVSASFASLGTNVLGSAGPTYVCNLAGTYYANALYDTLAGSDACAPGAPEIDARFSSTFSAWDFGTTGTPVSGKYSFTTVVLHELTHGLGFIGSMQVNASGEGTFFNPPLRFDRFMINGSGQYLVNFVNPSVALGAQLVSNNVFFYGSNAAANNAGVNPKLESSLNPFSQGSSLYHVDDALYSGTPNGLMTWQIGAAEVYTDPGPIVRGIFRDEGWTVGGVALSSASITGDRTAPQLVGTTTTFTASGTGGTSPYSFKFLVTTNNWATYSVARNWSTTPTFTWTPTVAGTYQVGVWARSSWDTADAPEAAVAVSFPIVDRPVMTAAAISADRVAPQPPGTIITFTATGAGGATPYAFKFLITNNNWATWTVLQDWSSAATAPWTPVTQSSTYQVGVWARGAGNTADAPEAAAAMAFAIAQPSVATLTVSVQGSGGVATGDAAIQCPSLGCSHTYTGAPAVTLQATPQAGFVFAGWSSPACSSGTVVMTADVMCNATFVPAVAGGARRGSLDLNGSGFGDVLTYNPRTGTRTFQFSDGLTHFGEVRAGWPAGLSVHPADFNGDGLTDFLVYAAASGGWSKAINTGGDFTYFNGPAWSAGASIFIVDLNGDHQSDVFVSNPATGAWSRCLSTGDGTGGLACTAGQWPVGLSIYPTDLNGDGSADFFLYNARTGQWSQALNDGGSGFTYNSGAWGAGLSVIPGDYNGDGRGDFFVYSSSTGRWSVVTTLPSLQFAYTSGTWSVGWTLTPGDFNGDGKTDLLLYNPANGWWYEGISSGSGDFALTFGTWSAGWQPQLADFNNDGLSDVLLYNSASGQWYQALTTGVGTFTYGTGVWDTGVTVIASTPRVP